MSRLDSFIRRMQAQRLLLDQSAAAIADFAGPVLELGLGNGRTYHHLREKLPGRRIVAFDIKVTAQPDSVPAAQDLVLGDIKDTALGFAGIGAALVHSDLGSGIPERDEETLGWLPALVPALLATAGLAISDLPLEDPRLLPLPLPDGVIEGRYWLYRRG
ncbi:S-adenosyl-L-methionine methyltransferase [Rhizobiales bacterium GAS191]|nr:S-adenosyl-L-methionine methyltransferase [Rhizobiales bacterium GAS188]SED49351.1 S-adenosyl-L-methionine methyltransferase [Rhizobiales bacterium GAS191]